MAINTKKLEGNIWKLHLYLGLYSIIFFTPIIVLFFQDNGLSFAQIMIIQALSSIIFIGFEVPSGYFADIYGRKTAMLITGLFSSVAMFIFAIGSDFYSFLFASVLWATAGVFISGADSALMYDTLKELGKEDQYKKVWGLNSFYYFAGGGVASIIGAFLGNIDFRYSFYAIIPFMILLIPLSLSFYEPPKHKNTIEKNYFHHLLKEIKSSIWENNKLKWLIIYAGVIGTFIDISYYFYQPYFELSGIDIIYFGFIFAGFSIITAISSKYAHIFEKRLGERHSLIALFLLIAISLLFMSHFIFLLGFIFAFLIQFVKGFSNVVISDYIHKLTKSTIRATVHSVSNLIHKSIFMVISPFMGYIVDLYSLQIAILFSGIMILFTGGITLFVFLSICKK